jgi:peptidoglycan LD-endopeptidase CwlK
MMLVFSKRSLRNLETCDDRLIHICRAVLNKGFDFSVLCGYRSDEEQTKLFNEGKSNAQAGQSKHNRYPSKAVDIAPYPIDWNDKTRFKDLAELMKEVAKEKQIKIVWGGDWKSIIDMPHFELED